MTLKVPTREELLTLAAKRFEVVGAGDLEAAMSVLVDEPVFDLYPIGLRLAGQHNVRRYYDHFFQTNNATLSAEHLGTFFSDDAIVFELNMIHQPPSGETTSFHLMAIMQMVDGRFTGERLYGDERLFRLLFEGPIWSLMTPIKG